eukprot:11197413-Lingulodinium_polyedra.AAC.1
MSRDWQTDRRAAVQIARGRTDRRTTTQTPRDLTLYSRLAPSLLHHSCVFCFCHGRGGLLQLIVFFPGGP